MEIKGVRKEKGTGYFFTAEALRSLFLTFSIKSTKGERHKAKDH
jgi:hypothetical protein